jgi:hypothetical protein
MPALLLEENGEHNRSTPSYYDHREYKYLLYIFNNNIAMFYNRMEKGVLGELEEGVKVTLRRDEKYVTGEILEMIL